ncbi:MAG: hypothetical protein K6T85_07780 [Gorillibacterium sp.]|nr:hypothetical protein [Gorillibacterium sp.]
MSADSRESIFDNGDHLATGEQVKKIHQVGDKVIFTAGSGVVTTDIVHDFTQANDQSIENLRSIAIKHVNLFVQQYGKGYLGKKTHTADLLVGFFEDGKSVLYVMSSEDGFQLQRNECHNRTDIICCGVRVDEAMEYYNNYKLNNDVVDMYKGLYKSLANEEIGGELTLYMLNTQGIRETKYPIIDSREIRIYEPSKALSNADKIAIQKGDGSGGNWVDVISMDSDGNAIFTGKVTASEIEGGSVIGAIIKTAEIGRRIELDLTGFRVYDSSGHERITIDSADGHDMGGIIFSGETGYSGQIVAADTLFTITGLTDMLIQAIGHTLNISGNVNFSSASVSGLGVGKVAGLVDELNSIKGRLATLEAGS